MWKFPILWDISTKSMLGTHSSRILQPAATGWWKWGYKNSTINLYLSLNQWHSDPTGDEMPEYSHITMSISRLMIPLSAMRNDIKCIAKHVLKFQTTTTTELNVLNQITWYFLREINYLFDALLTTVYRQALTVTHPWTVHSIACGYRITGINYSMLSEGSHVDGMFDVIQHGKHYSLANKNNIMEWVHTMVAMANTLVQ